MQKSCPRTRRVPEGCLKKSFQSGFINDSHLIVSLLSKLCLNKTWNFLWNVARTWKTRKRTVSRAQRLRHAILTLQETVCWSEQRANVLWSSGVEGLTTWPDSPVVWWVLFCLFFLLLFQFYFEFVVEKQKRKKTEEIFRENFKTVWGRSWPYQYVWSSILWCTYSCLIPQKHLVLTSDQNVSPGSGITQVFLFTTIFLVSFEKWHMISDIQIS